MTEHKMKWSANSFNFDAARNIFKEKALKSEFGELEEYEEMEGEEIRTLMETPFGTCFLDDDLNPYKQFEFWLGHTNFNITRQVADIIESTPGVEVLKLISRYRFIIGVGQLFAFQDVRASIQQQLCGTAVDLKSLQARIQHIKEDLAEYPDWAIYVFPNGEIEFSYLDQDLSNVSDFVAKKNLLIEAQALSKGQLYLHEPLGNTLASQE